MTFINAALVAEAIILQISSYFLRLIRTRVNSVVTFVVPVSRRCRCRFRVSRIAMPLQRSNAVDTLADTWLRLRHHRSLIGTVQIIERIYIYIEAAYRDARNAGDAYSTDPLGQTHRCDNNQRNKPTYDQQGYTSPVRAASVSRTTCPLNIHEPPPASVLRRSEMDDFTGEGEGERERARAADSIDPPSVLRRWKCVLMLLERNRERDSCRL